jgi:hypothetical protein
VRGTAACPTPDKGAFQDEEQAEARADYIRSIGGDSLESYPCPCGKWHLRGRTKYRKKQRYYAKREKMRAAQAQQRAEQRRLAGFELEDLADAIVEAMGITERIEN